MRELLDALLDTTQFACNKEVVDGTHSEGGMFSRSERSSELDGPGTGPESNIVCALPVRLGCDPCVCEFLIGG